ncbi:MAG: ABC transporter permease [Dehalococcoidia bacterium]|nr:ABC transporter permease [Dehalococcoidia bacterium]
MNVITIANFTFHEALRKKVVLAAAVLSFAFLALYALGFHFFVTEAARSVRVSGTASIFAREFGVLVMMGLYVVNFFGGLLAIFTAVGTISGEIESGTLHAVVPKPIRRWEIMVGKWLGYAIMLSVYVFVMAWGVIGLSYVQNGYLPSQPLYGSCLMVLVSLLLLSLTFAGSAIFTTVTNGIVVFMLYGIASVGGMVEGIGTLIQSEILLNIGIVSSLIVPSDVIWKSATYFLQPRLFDLIPVPTPFSSVSPPSLPMIAYAIGYCVVVLLAGIKLFQQRDL